ncbi:MAG: hypothetical protein JWN86_448 [Planctomycetota bacterium]|nr:hypothetical protein [Planctomycetota bacterium]
MNGENVPPPTREQIAELVGAVSDFLKKDGLFNIAWLDESEWLPLFGRVADALRPLRSFPPRLDGWPQRTGRAIRGVASAFDGITSDWGWEAIAEPEPSRSAHVKACRDRFLETVERTMYEAAVSWQAGSEELPIPKWVDTAAEDGWNHGYRPTMSPEQGMACWDDVRAKWLKTPPLGKCAPEVAEPRRLAIIEAFNLLESALKDADTDAKRREVKESASPAPVQLAAPFSSPPSEDDEAAPINRALAGVDAVAELREADSSMRPAPSGICSLPQTIDEAIQALRRKRATTQAALIEYMQDRKTASIDDVGFTVHGDTNTSEDAIRQNITRINKSMIEYKMPLRFGVGGGYVHKEVLPE